MSAVDTETRTDEGLRQRLIVNRLLAKTGWKCTVSWARHQGEKVPLFVAIHDHYPVQMAVRVEELLRRCWWQEDNRLVPLGEN